MLLLHGCMFFMFDLAAEAPLWGSAGYAAAGVSLQEVG
jgi:hypothetical protein